MSHESSNFKTNLERWRYYLQDLESPDLFINWTFYAMISAALQRRVAVGGMPGIQKAFQIYPNQFIIFIGGPGAGKSLAANEAKALFKSFVSIETGELQSPIKLGPDSMTLEAMTKYLSDNYSKTRLPSNDKTKKDNYYLHASLALFCGDELGTLIREQTNDTVIFLNQAWDCGDFHRVTKTSGIDLIMNMCVTLLGAATPEWVKNNVNSRLLNEGFSARVIFVYADKKRHLKYRINITDDQRKELSALKEHVRKLIDLCGEVKASKEVDAWCEDWYAKKNLIFNKDKKLAGYYARKKIHLIKTAMAIHFADNLDLSLTIKDFELASQLLIETEKDMDKALGGSGRNPINQIAEEIKKFLSIRDKVSFREILIEFFDNGTKEEIIAAITFLQEIGELETTGENGETYYAKKKNV